MKVGSYLAIASMLIDMLVLCQELLLAACILLPALSVSQNALTL